MQKFEWAVCAAPSFVILLYLSVSFFCSSSLCLLLFFILFTTTLFDFLWEGVFIL